MKKWYLINTILFSLVIVLLIVLAILILGFKEQTVLAQEILMASSLVVMTGFITTVTIMIVLLYKIKKAHYLENVNYADVDNITSDVPKKFEVTPTRSIEFFHDGVVVTNAGVESQFKYSACTFGIHQEMMDVVFLPQPFLDIKIKTKTQPITISIPFIRDVLYWVRKYGIVVRNENVLYNEKTKPHITFKYAFYKKNFILKTIILGMLWIIGIIIACLVKPLYISTALFIPFIYLVYYIYGISIFEYTNQGIQTRSILSPNDEYYNFEDIYSYEVITIDLQTQSVFEVYNVNYGMDQSQCQVGKEVIVITTYQGYFVCENRPQTLEALNKQFGKEEVEVTAAPATEA